MSDPFFYFFWFFFDNVKRISYIFKNSQVADEPTGNLDPDTARGIMDILEKINQEGTTIVMATHNSFIVNEYRHRVIEISDGKIVRDQEEGDYTDENSHA